MGHPPSFPTAWLLTVRPCSPGSRQQACGFSLPRPGSAGSVKGHMAGIEPGGGDSDHWAQRPPGTMEGQWQLSDGASLIAEWVRSTWRTLSRTSVVDAACGSQGSRIRASKHQSPGRWPHGPCNLVGLADHGPVLPNFKAVVA